MDSPIHEEYFFEHEVLRVFSEMDHLNEIMDGYGGYLEWHVEIDDPEGNRLAFDYVPEWEGDGRSVEEQFSEWLEEIGWDPDDDWGTFDIDLDSLGYQEG